MNFNHKFYITAPNSSLLLRVSHNHRSISRAMVVIRFAVAEWDNDHPDVPYLNWFELIGTDIDIPGVKLEQVSRDSIVVVYPGKSVVLL